MTLILSLLKSLFFPSQFKEEIKLDAYQNAGHDGVFEADDRFFLFFLSE